MASVTIVAHDIGPVGGMELVLRKLVDGLAARGEEVVVIARSCSVAEPSRVRVHRVRGPRRPFVIAYPWFALAAAVTLARHRRGIVHSTGAIVLGPIDVVSVHLVHHATAWSDGLTRSSRQSRLFRVHAHAAAWMARVGERLAYRPQRARAFVAVSTGVADELRELLPACAEQVVVIANGVDTETFHPDASARASRGELGLPLEGLVALFVGSEWERKQLRCAVEALALAPDWHLAVLGLGDSRAYTEHARELGVADRVHFFGVVDGVSAFYRAADAFLLPTHYETFSLATYEAAASGLPLLATDVSGIRDLLQDGVNGFLITSDPGTIADRLRRLTADAPLRARMGRAAREASLAFGWDAMVDRHHALYERLGAAHVGGGRVGLAQ
jgi:UDP-glucose:(heptosyl)LPS alpha-1,3-glucosyltransferase